MDKHKVIVIGTGIAGALTAYKLSKAGVKVLMLEAGLERSKERVSMSGEFAKTTRKTPGSPYVAKGDKVESPDYRESTNPNDEDLHYYEFVKEGEKTRKFKSTYQRIVGGSTWHWLGNVPRFIPNDFKMHTLYGRGKDWPISYDDIEPYYCEAEREIGVSGNHEKWDGYLGAYRSETYPMQEIWQCYGDQQFIKTLEGESIQGYEITVMPTPQARNSENYQGRPACAGNSSCVPICPINAKYDATYHVKQAIKAGAELRSGAVVYRLVKDSNNIICKIIYCTPERKDVEIDTTNKTVVLAAHCIESTKILLMSDVANSSGMVGKNLMDHVQGYVVAETNEPVYPFRGPLTTSGIDIFRDGEFRKKHAAFRLSIGNDGWGRVKSLNDLVRRKLLEGKLGQELFESIGDSASKLIRISYSTEVLPSTENYVTLSDKLDRLGLPRPKISFDKSEYNDDAFKFAREVCKEIFEKVGVTYVDTLEYRSYSGAGHVIGTTCMGSNSKNSVVDSKGKTHDHDNLYIVGAGVFTTSATANPTLTVAALSLKTADHILQELKI